MALVTAPQSLRWHMVVTLGGSDVSARQTGTVRVELEAGTARIAEFSLRPVSQTIVLPDWLGAAVTIDYVRAGSSPERVFTGVVSLPTLDPDTRVVRFQCTDARQMKLEAMERSGIDALLPGSKWSADVFDDEAGGLRYAEDRLTTLPASLDLARDGSTWRLTEWALPAGTEFEFEQVVDGSLGVQTPELPELLNEVHIEFDYRFTRRRQRNQAWYWLWRDQNGDDGFCFWFADTTELPDMEMIQRAAERGGWTPNPNSWQFTPLPASAPDPCNTGVGWTNPGFPTVLHAEWTAAMRTSQFVTEHYALTVRAPQSISAHDALPRHERGGAETRHDLGDWEAEPVRDFLADQGELDGFAADSLGDLVRDFTDRDQMDLAVETMLAAARVRILDSHRRNIVSWDWPDHVPGLDAGSAVAVDALGVTAEGRVMQLIETFDMPRGTVRSTIRLAVSRAGSDDPVTEDTLEAPAAPDTTPAGVGPDPQPIDLATQIGGGYAAETTGRLDSPPYDADLDGFAGNFSAIDPSAETYPRRFQVTTPEVESEVRDPVERDADATYDVEIPNDTLTTEV